jgi:hypothetical protein
VVIALVVTPEGLPLAYEARSDVETGPNPSPSREVSDTDLRQGRVLATGLAATIAGFAATGETAANGGVAVSIFAPAAAAAGVGIATTLIGRQRAKVHTSCLGAQLARGGILLWVHMRDPGVEKTVLDVLRQHSTKVSIHDDAGKGASIDGSGQSPLSSISRPEGIRSRYIGAAPGAGRRDDLLARAHRCCRSAAARRRARKPEALHRSGLGRVHFPRTDPAVRDESGVGVGAVHSHSSQPLPFRANIMRGFYAEALSQRVPRGRLSPHQGFRMPVGRVIEAGSREERPGSAEPAVGQPLAELANRVGDALGNPRRRPPKGDFLPRPGIAAGERADTDAASRFREPPSLLQMLHWLTAADTKFYRTKGSARGFTKGAVHQKGMFVMRKPAETQANRVRAMFRDATILAFYLNRDTTLGQLAEKIGNMARFHGGLFVPVHVRLALGRRVAPGR